MTVMPTLAFLEFFLAVFGIVILPKSAVAVFFFMAAVGVAFLWQELREIATTIAPSRSTRWLAALAVWMGVSALWSLDPRKSLAIATYLPVLAAATALLVQVSKRAPIELVAKNRHGISAGVLLGVVLLSVELLSDQAGARWVFTHYPFLSETAGRHVFYDGAEAIHVSEASANRRAFILVLFFLPLMYHLMQLKGSRQGQVTILGALLAYTAVFVLTESLSAQLALVAGGSATIMTGRLPLIARKIVAAGWSALVLFMIPIVLVLHGAGLQKSEHLPASARERVVIWVSSARVILRHPIVGIGANASDVALRVGTGSPVERTPLGLTEFFHTHNAYLQIWLELGAVGVLLLLGLGLSILAQIATLSATLQPYAAGQFAVTATLLTSSYGLWDSWVMAAVAISYLALVLADAVSARTEAENSRL